MNYIELVFRLNQPYSENNDLLMSYLSQFDFSGFEESEMELLAYVAADKYEVQIVQSEMIRACFNSYEQNTIEEQNWNKVWEDNYFQPIEITDECIIRAPFHTVEKHYEHDILIQPRMSFGTGHHSTTYLIAAKLFEMDLKQKTLLDMGCGTAILAILAKRLGAGEVRAIDNDKWAYENSLDNIVMNKVPDIKIELGDANLLLDNVKYDIILSNINLNINMENIPYYANVNNKGGLLLLSGFYNEDIAQIDELCQSLGYKFIEKTEQKNWAMLVYQFSK